MKKIIEIAKSEKMIKRYKAFGWSLGAMTVITALAFLTDILNEWNAESVITVIIGLIAAQITKYLNTKTT